MIAMGVRSRRRPAWPIAVVLWLAWATAACEAPPAEVPAPALGGALRVGMHAWDMPGRVEASFASIEATLEPVLERALVHHGAGQSVEIVPFAVYGELVDAVARGHVDVARLEAGAFLAAQERAPGLALLAAEQSARGRARRGVIVTSAHGDIDTLDELRGKRFAFGDEHAAIGRYLPQAALLEAGLRAADLGGWTYLGRGDRIAAAVRLGEFDAGVIDAELFPRVNVDGSLRALAPPLLDAPRPWVARAGLEPRLVGALRAALLDLHDATCLRVLEAAGFGRMSDDDYDPVRAAMAAAVAFATGADASASAARSRP